MLSIRLFLWLAWCVSMARTAEMGIGLGGDTIAQTQFALFTDVFDEADDDENQKNVGPIVMSPESGPDRDHRVEFGSAVALDRTGQFMLVGAPNFSYVSQDEVNFTKLAVENVANTTTAQGIYCHQCGAVFLYRLTQPQQTNSSSTNKKKKKNKNKDAMSWTRVLSMTGHVQENLGNFIHLHPDGKSWAVRRGDGTVETFAVTGRGGGRRFGSAIANCPGHHVQLTGDFLVASCELRNNRIGTVDIFEYASTTINSQLDWIWRATVPLKGNEPPGTRLGWKIALDDKPTRGKLLRLAISAPLWQASTGLVRVYELDSDFQLQQLGPDLTGNNEGDKFGFGLTMTRRHTSKPMLAITMPGFGTEGVPGRGGVDIYEYSRFQNLWILRGHFVGSTADTEDRLGRAVSMSRDGRLVAVCTNRTHTFAGSVMLYQRVNDTTYVEAQELVGHSERVFFGTDVALNEYGSILVSGAIKEKNDEGIPVGSVRTFLDQSPFCSLPKDGDNFRPLDYLLQRPICIDRSSLIMTEEACQAQLEVVGNENTLVSCVWKDILEDANVSAVPSPAPTPAAPTGPLTETMAPSNPPADVIQVDIRLEACLCNSNRECITTPLTFDNPLIVCVVTTNKDIDGTSIELLSVSSLRLDQSSDSDSNNSIIVMDETGVHIPGARSSCEGNACQIHCPTLDLTSLFERGRDTVMASGTVSITAPEQRRNLRLERANIRILNNDNPETAVFTANITLATRFSLTDNDNDDADYNDLASTSRILWIMLACFVGLMICCCLGLLKMKSRSSAPKIKRVAKQKNKPLKSLREQEQAADALE
jgi:hypothetical protein